MQKSTRKMKQAFRTTFRTVFFAMLFIFLTIWIGGVESHGRLMNPPARNAMWRFGFPNPVDYNDNELFCGGYAVQQVTNKGKCGVCGDDWRLDVPRPHEIGGIYGNGIIVRRYYSGQDISVKVDLTSNHHGFFIFKICPATSSTEEVTQECLNRYPLKIVHRDGTTSRKYKITTNDRSGSFEMRVRLPVGLTCERCVIQWTYITGNSWGQCQDGSQQMGCGPQENFVNCADVSITSKGGNSFFRLGDPALTSSSRANPHMMYFKDFSKEGAPITPLIIRYQVCIATKQFEILPGIDDWCHSGCMRYPPYCPPDICRCVEDCTAVGEFSQKHGSDQWCLDECSVYPPRNCTADRCSCW